jgi:hypothetical protein
MMRLAPLLLLALLPLGACGSKREAATAAGEDPIQQLDAGAADASLSVGQSEIAIGQYRRAFERARARDDAAAIGDYGYDLAVAQLVANEPRQALASVRLTRIELARRRAPSFPALDLAEATAHYRVGEKQESDRLALEAASGGDAAIAARAIFLRGLIADDRGDAAGLSDAISSLKQPTSDDQRADVAELSARRDLRQGAFEPASTEAQRAADLRRGLLDYRGMARALSIAGDAEARAGDAQAAAAFYMRAGQSAAAFGDAQSARLWLRRSIELGHDANLREAAKSALAGLDKPSRPGNP